MRKSDLIEKVSLLTVKVQDLQTRVEALENRLFVQAPAPSIYKAKATLEDASTTFWQVKR